MINYILNKLRNFREKKVFHEYEYKTVTFHLENEGPVQYAQWLHPGEFGNEVLQENVNFYKQFVKKGDFIIDIGANEGDTTVPMALAAGSNGTTLAFEPNHHVFKILKVNSDYNKDKTNIIPLNLAVTTEDGEYTFGSGDPSYGNGGIVGFTHNKKRNTRYTFKVTGKNLERYLKTNYANLLPQLKFIKIDAEGYDKEIIKTILGLIDTYRPYLVTECFGPATKDEKLELFDLLTSRNYNLYQTDFTINLGAPISKDSMATKNTYDILAVPKEKEN